MKGDYCVHDRDRKRTVVREYYTRMMSSPFPPNNSNSIRRKALCERERENVFWGVCRSLSVEMQLTYVCPFDTILLLTTLHYYDREREEEGGEKKTYRQSLALPSKSRRETTRKTSDRLGFISSLSSCDARACVCMSQLVSLIHSLCVSSFTHSI
jgi:hypothetical protein